MKRSGNLFERIVSVNNIMLAHKNAKKGKRHYREVKCFELRPYHNARKIRNMLIAKVLKMKNPLRSFTIIPFVKKSMIQLKLF